MHHNSPQTTGVIELIIAHASTGAGPIDAGALREASGLGDYTFDSVLRELVSTGQISAHLHDELADTTKPAIED